MAEHNHNARSLNVTVAGCPGCDQAVAEMSPVERAMRDLRVAADKSRGAWDWHFECLRHLGRRRTGPEAVVLRQSEDDAENSDRELGKAAVRYAAAVTAAAPATSVTDLTADEIANWASGRPQNPTTAQGTYMALEIQRHRAARFVAADRVRIAVMDAVQRATTNAIDAALGEVDRQVGSMGHVLKEARGSGMAAASTICNAIADGVAEQLAPPSSSTILDANTRDVIMAIIAAKDQQSAWLEAAALRTLLGLVDRGSEWVAERARIAAVVVEAVKRFMPIRDEDAEVIGLRAANHLLVGGGT